MKLVRRKMTKETEELNITAFLNLMVILVPFLLITAVFSRITILELNLPPKNVKVVPPEKVTLQLELVITPDSFEIRDSNLGRIKYLVRDPVKQDWKTFTDLLVEIKSRFPNEQDITLLLDRDVTYKTLIQVMDRVRSAEVVNLTELEIVELFPNVSIGDGPGFSDDASQSSKAVDQTGKAAAQ